MSTPDTMSYEDAIFDALSRDHEFAIVYLNDVLSDPESTEENKVKALSRVLRALSEAPTDEKIKPEPCLPDLTPAFKKLFSMGMQLTFTPCQSKEQAV